MLWPVDSMVWVFDGNANVIHCPRIGLCHGLVLSIQKNELNDVEHLGIKMNINSESMLIGIAIIGGIAIALQGQFMGQIEKNMGTTEAVFLTYGLGGLVVSLFMLYLKGGLLLSHWQQVPWYVYSSGLLGLVIVTSITITIPKLGMAQAFIWLLVGQFFIAALVDHFGWLNSAVREIGLKQAVGLVLLLFAAYLVTSK